MPMTLTKGAQATAPLPRRWRVWCHALDAEEKALQDVMAPDAWVKGGHLFVGVFETQKWTAAWAPGGWLSCELMPSDDLSK